LPEDRAKPPREAPQSLWLHGDEEQMSNCSLKKTAGDAELPSLPQPKAKRAFISRLCG
jgi:hypothetical protein